ncbi:hypothetical protein JOB18_033180 [Solea senegalensis]|uniref:Uncharacterized protein n=1 Tax=Solea senegalensis TaxID=28829 RepID=A0AAV6SUA9_SOLSE|nr:hypothetical protein JOB18_033180 [Solea senegalensis]
MTTKQVKYLKEEVNSHTLVLRITLRVPLYYSPRTCAVSASNSCAAAQSGRSVCAHARVVKAHLHHIQQLSRCCTINYCCWLTSDHWHVKHVGVTLTPPNRALNRTSQESHAHADFES